jgi:hypothetical protein
MNPASLERRQMRRFSGHDHGIVSARVRPGHEVSIVDVSAGGALLESDYRFMPGSAVELQLEVSGERAAVRGRVLRCAVARLHSTWVCYRGAIRFDRHLPWLVDGQSVGYDVPSTSSHRVGPTRSVS